MSKNQEDLKDKTELAIERTTLANTRTFSAWVRSGLSSVSVGLAIVKFLGDNKKHKSFVSIIGALFVLIGTGIYIFGYLNYKKSYEKINDERLKLSVPLSVLLILTVGLTITSILILVLIVLYI